MRPPRLRLHAATPRVGTSSRRSVNRRHTIDKTSMHEHRIAAATTELPRNIHTRVGGLLYDLVEFYRVHCGSWKHIFIVSPTTQPAYYCVRFTDSSLNVDTALAWDRLLEDIHGSGIIAVFLDELYVHLVYFSLSCD